MGTSGRGHDERMKGEHHERHCGYRAGRASGLQGVGSLGGDITREKPGRTQFGECQTGCRVKLEVE